MPELLVMPDAERIVIAYLTAELTGGVPVLLEVPNPRPDKFVVVQRVGGVRMNIVADKPLIVVESWDKVTTAAKETAAEARALLHAARGTVVGGVTIYHVGEAAGPAHLPDPASHHARYTFTVEMGMRGSRLGS